MPNTKTRLCPFLHVPYHKGTMVVPPLPVIMRINARYLIESYIFTILWTSQYLSFSLFSCSKKAMYLLHKFLNIVLLPLNLIVLLFFIPPFLILKFLWSLKRSIYSENVSGKVVLITGASSGIGEVCINPSFVIIDSGRGQTNRVLFTLVHVKFSVYFSITTYFFYFSQLVFQNTYISQSILEDISIKYSSFINCLLFSLMVILFLI